jgi:hypothetical protein
LSAEVVTYLTFLFVIALFVASTWRAVNDFKLVAYRCCSSLPHAEQSKSRKRKKVTKDKLNDNKELNSNLEKLQTNGNDKL